MERKDNRPVFRQQEARLGIFGGTLEGRLLAEFCREHEIPAAISVATSYGRQLLFEHPGITIHEGRMEASEMVQWIRTQKLWAVVDATHPYAKEVSEQIREACRSTGIGYHRLVRKSEQEEAEKRQEQEKKELVFVNSLEEGIAFLKQELALHPDRRVLVTTGSKELFRYAAIPDAPERIFARVLPSEDGILACTGIGLKGRHIFAVQGPFSYEMNRAMLQAAGASYLITKESGREGGFQEKVDAALDLGCCVVIVGRPIRENGKSLAEIQQWLMEPCREKDSEVFRKECQETCREVILAGIGGGNPEQMTLEAIRAILDSDALLGASRMVESGREVCRLFEETKTKKERLEYLTYRPEEMLAWLKEHPRVRHPVILYSGDVGFFSGAQGMLQKAEQESGAFVFRMIPGISSLSCFAARLGKSWEKVRIISLHGRDEEMDWSLADQAECFLLLDGTRRLHAVCRKLIENGQKDARIWVGERLSYKEERIFSGSPEELLERSIEKLSAAWIVPQQIDAALPDGEPPV